MFLLTSFTSHHALILQQEYKLILVGNKGGAQYYINCALFVP